MRRFILLVVKKFIMDNRENKNISQDIQQEFGSLATRGDSKNSYAIPIAILVAGIIIAGAVVYSNGNKALNQPALLGGSTAPSAQNAKPKDVPVDIKNVDLNGEPFIGSPDAPITIAYWLDFQCPFCKRFETQTLPVLIDKYVKTGKLKIVFKDFQFLGPDSQIAGLFSKAVWELYPQEYFKWHKTMYEAQDAENAGFGNKESIINLIKDKLPQLNAKRIALLVEQKKDEYQKEQDADKVEGSLFGIRGTPGFIIGNQRISGAQPTDIFVQLIDARLSK